MIFFFALVTRAAMVGSGTRNAAAISAVVSPQISRSASATCASRLSAGWQQVNYQPQPVVGDDVLAVGRRLGLGRSRGQARLDQQR